MSGAIFDMPDGWDGIFQDIPLRQTRIPQGDCGRDGLCETLFSQIKPDEGIGDGFYTHRVQLYDKHGKWTSIKLAGVVFACGEGPPRLLNFCPWCGSMIRCLDRWPE